MSLVIGAAADVPWWNPLRVAQSGVYPPSQWWNYKMGTRSAIILPFGLQILVGSAGGPGSPLRMDY